MEYRRMSKTRAQRPLNSQIRTEASEWLLRFSEGEIDADGREEFNEWLRTSAEHVRAYLRVSAFWQEAGDLDGKQRPRDIETLVAQANAKANVFSLFGSPVTDSVAGWSASLDAPQRARPVFNRKYRLLAIAASLAAMAGAFGIYQQLNRNVYETRVGEQRTVNLPDGSTVVLNADSKVKVRYSETERVIDLDAGQALFKVGKNPARPFIVRSGDASVRAMGTEFDVYRKEASTTVTVVEGKVAVISGSADDGGEALDAGEGARSLAARPRVAKRLQHGLSVVPAVAPVFLIAGEQLTIPKIAAHDAHVAKNGNAPTESAVRAVKIGEATAWTEGILIFDGAPLADVIHEFNRQNSKRLILEGSSDLSQLKISGAFPANGSERITKFLQERFSVVVHETDDDIRLSRQ